MNWINKKNLLKEPLLHFLLIGAVLFLLFDWKSKPTQMTGGQAGTQTAQITVSRDAIEQIASQFAKTWQREPTEEEQKTLIEDLIRNEIYYREAIAIGLDRDDEVLKRRMRQKMEFIYEDISSWAEPMDADLMSVMKKNRAKYLTDSQIAFHQVYINTNKRGKSSEGNAQLVLSQLTAGADPDTVGDSTMLEAEVRLSPLWDIRKQFGDEFGMSILHVKPGAWAGPIKSAYGLHLVFVKERRDGRLPDLKEIRETVKRDWLVEKQKEMKDGAYAKLRERYTVVVEKQKDGTLAAATRNRTVNR